jgi:two-component system response regulator GlrR
MPGENILIVDDDRNLLEVLRLRLETENYQVTVADKAEKALKLAAEINFDLALLDLKLNEGEKDGINLMDDLHHSSPEMPIIILTAYGTIKNAVEAIKLGAYNYLTKPFDHYDLLMQIKNGLEKSRLAREVQRLKALVQEKFNLTNIIGKSSVMKEIMQKTCRAAETDSNVYIYGESGTGKELIAKSLHLLSDRKDGPFVAINCASIPEGLLEAELFGYEKGAFTGAVRKKKGLFCQAHTGTLFLDEISETPMSMQVKLLRVLEDKQFYTLSGENPVNVDIRIIAAANKELEQAVKEGSFREDLYYRLHVIPIHIPPLRERMEDIPILANHFLQKFYRKQGKESMRIAQGALQKLLSYEWPGNVRELENTIEYAVAMSTGDIIEADLILTRHDSNSQDLPTLKEAKNAFEKEYLIRALIGSEGNITKAADSAGKYRADFYDLLKKHDLKVTDFKKPDTIG